MPTDRETYKPTEAEKETQLLKSLSKAALADYRRLKKRKNVRLDGVPWWIISKDLRGGYKKKAKKRVKKR